MTALIRIDPHAGPGAVPVRRPVLVARGASLRGAPRRLGVVLGLLFTVIAPPALAPAQETPAPAAFDLVTPTSANWVVLEAVGEAVWRAQGDRPWRTFTPGEVLPPGCEIETGQDGEVVLVAGGDQLTVAPLGRLIVPEAAPGQDRRLRHERGRILVHIESRENRDVQVKTPLLSLGIKGTNFEIDIDAEQNSVVVHDGVVEVTPPDGQDPVELGAGEGLRQSTAPGSAATRFTAPPPETSSAAGAGRALDPFPVPDRSGGAVAIARPDTEMEVRSGAAHASRQGEPRAPGPARRPWGWVDDWASSWAWVAIAAVALLFLAIPMLMIVHHLRERWQGSSGGEGRRRRELVRG